MNDNVNIAKEILSQLGGNKLVVMAGAKNFLAIDNGIQFSIGKNAAGINKVVIKLNGMDLYDVEYGRVAKKKGVPTWVVKVSDEGIYNDMLVESFEKATGMYLNF